MEEKEKSYHDLENVAKINPTSVASKIEKEEEKEIKKKKGCKFPTAYTILLIIEIIVFILTYIIPKGKFDTIEYSKNKFIIKSFNRPDEIINATENILEEKGINIPLDNFIKGYIKKPISIPNTYQKIENDTTYFFDLFLYPMSGLIESADIAFFIMVIGGTINILTEMNAISAGMEALSRKTRGREFLLAILVFLILAIVGTTIGICEEIFPFFPILMPIFLKSGLDGILSMTPLYMGSTVGNIFSTINSFQAVLGSYSAGINFIDGVIFRAISFVIGVIITIFYLYYYYRRIRRDETQSYTYDIKKDLEDKYLKEEKVIEEKVNEENEDIPLLKKPKEEKMTKFTWMQIISLLIFLSGFIMMMIGVLFLDWWFEHMASFFFIISIILIIFLKKGEQKGIEAFTKGFGDLAGVSLIIGIGRGINITLEKGKISDTILNNLSSLIDGLPKIIFAILMLLIFIILGIFIQSVTGLAVLALPVLAPLADKIECSRTIVVNAYIFGQSYIGLISPTGLALIVLQMVGIKYNQWIRFIWPYMIIMFVYLIILMSLNAILEI